MPSFDVVSEVDLQEVDNAVNQAKKELTTRWDFKNSKSEVDLDKKNGITLVADDEMKLKSLTEILHQKLAKRGVSIRSLDPQTAEGASGGMQRQLIKIKQGIAGDDAKKIVKLIKDQNLKKIQASIQGEQVRVTGPKIDDLQAVIRVVKEKIELDLQFTNFRD